MTRDVRLTIRFLGGHSQEVIVREDAPELRTLYATISQRDANRFVELPISDGRIACSFHSSQVVSIVSEPPVLIQQQRVTNATRTAVSRRERQSRHLVIDNFLSRAEYDDLLAHAIGAQAHFQAGALANFADSTHAKRLENRILVYFPFFVKLRGVQMFPLRRVESQMSTARDGYSFKSHTNEGPRGITCVYHLHREPCESTLGIGLRGGELRLYDSIEEGAQRRAAETFTTILPAANRLVLFCSNEFHESMPIRTTSKEIADCRFMITTSLHRSDRVDMRPTFGWGHFYCGSGVPQFT